MGYRSIKIDNDTYNYTVGKSHLHIKGGRLKKPVNVPKTAVGLKCEWRCECCGETYTELGYSAALTGFDYMITPAVVRGVVLRHITPAAA
jgi:hypothetical protein